eukprot:scaffold53081_cov61-Phaeocystis_antarctica.AAC.6
MVPHVTASLAASCDFRASWTWRCPQDHDGVSPAVVVPWSDSVASSAAAPSLRALEPNRGACTPLIFLACVVYTKCVLFELLR